MRTLTMLLVFLMLVQCKTRQNEAEMNTAESGTSSADNDKPASAMVFPAELTWESYAFRIDVEGQSTGQTMTLQAEGPGLQLDALTHEIAGTVRQAEVADLDGDGLPEIMAFIYSGDEKGSMIGYTLTAEKTLTRIHLPGLKQRNTLIRGYRGQDEFEIVEDKLVRRFPVYSDDESNPEPTGTIRRIQYRLKDTSQPGRFEVDRIMEFPG